MENREDIINSPSFENLKSYTIFRRRAPPIHNSADVVLAQTSFIRNWHFKLVSSTSSRYWFVLYGTVNNSFIKSSLVTDVVEDIVRTENSFYKLCGDMSTKCDPHRHFDKELLKQFQHGFPSNWRNLLENEIKRIVTLEASLATRENASTAAKKSVIGQYEERNVNDKSSIQDSACDKRDILQQDAEKLQTLRESASTFRETETLSTANNIAKSRLSLEKKLIAQKAAEILSSDSEDVSLIQKSPEKIPKSNGKKRGRKKKIVNEFIHEHEQEKIDRKQEDKDRRTSEKDDDSSSAKVVVALRKISDDEAKKQVAVIKKRVSFNTEDIQEIFLDGNKKESAAVGGVPDVPMDLVAGEESEKGSEDVNFEGTDSVLQMQAVAQPRKRGRAKSLDKAEKQNAAKYKEDAKNNDDRKPGAKKKRKRLTMPAGFKA